MNLLLVFLGAAAGGILRYLVMVGVTRALGEEFPWGTLVVNGAGSFLLGFFFGAEALWAGLGISLGAIRLIGVAGLCGGLTTFSTFSLQTLTLLSKGQTARVFANIFGSLALCLLAILAGFSLGGLAG